MKTFLFLSLLLASTLATGCAFEQSLETLQPDSAFGQRGRGRQRVTTGGSSSGGGSASGGGSTSTAAQGSPARGARPRSRVFRSATAPT